GLEGKPLEASALWQHSDSELREGGQVRGTAGGRREIALHAGGITLPPSGKIAGTERPLRSQASRRQTRYSPQGRTPAHPLPTRIRLPLPARIQQRPLAWSPLGVAATGPAQGRKRARRLHGGWSKVNRSRGLSAKLRFVEDVVLRMKTCSDPSGTRC